MKQKYSQHKTAGRLTFVLCSLLALASCNLDYDPVSEFSDVTVGTTGEGGQQVVFKNRAEAFAQYESLYQLLRDRQEHWYLDILLLAESHADNAYAGTTGAEVVPFENNSIDGSNSVLSRDWERYLADIAAANKLICNIDSVPDASFSKAERAQWKAEAKIFRAMIMFDMARIWGAFPIITTEAPDITSENIEEVYPLYFPEQGTEEEAYTQIIKDLLEALPDAPDNNGDKTRLSKSVARAMLAKAYAEKPLQDYGKVIQYCNELETDGFRLIGNYEDLFGMNEASTDCKARNTDESILEIQYPLGSGNWVTWMFGRNLTNWDESFTWAKWITPSRNLIAAFQAEGDDIRMNQAIVYYECTWSNYYPANHYPFMYKCRSAFSNINKIRYADILLLKAEALIQKENDLQGAAAIIKDIRGRVGLPALTAAETSSKEAMIAALLKERRLELAFEGQRWFDLCRLDKVEEVMNAVYAKDSGRKSMAHAFTKNSYKLPIPQNALDANENLVQNPGY